MRKMTHNEYAKYCREAMEKYWNSGSFKDFKKDIKDIEVIPYELSEYPKLSEESKNGINALFAEEDVDKNGKRLFKGFCNTEIIWKVRERLGIHVKEGNYISGYGVNNDEYLILSWCEGDIFLQVFSTEDEFRKEDASCREFYENN